MTASSESATPNVTTQPAPVGATKRTSRPAPGLRSRARHSANEQQPTRPQQLLALLSRRQGATTAEMLTLTNWQPHSLRAALSGLRKQGHVLERDHDRNGQLRYRLVKPATRTDVADC